MWYNDVMDIPKRKLGKTGVDVTIMGLGGEGVLRTYGYEREAYELINRAIDLGITYFESARAYSGSESYYGRSLRERRKEIFLTSKSHARNKRKGTAPSSGNAKMARLAPAFKKDGTVTAGNASGINDAAAAVLVMSRAKAKELGLEPMVTIKSYASGGVDPAYMGLGPIPSSRKALARAGLTIKDIDVIELNEAFASQVIASMTELGINLDNTNPNGSGISLGHPIGATGCQNARFNHV